MSLIRAFVISFVFMLVAQGSLEAGQLFAPRDPKTEDRTINNRLAICESRCRSERQDTLHFQKRAPQLSQLCLRECMKSKEEDVVTKNMRIRQDVVGEKRKQEKKENCLIPSLFLDYHSVKATVEVDFLERKPNLSISWKPVYTDPWYNWTSYAIFYQSGEGQPFCKLIPKDQHKFILADGEGWEYPSAIHMVIYTYPHSKESSHLLKTYYPPARPLPTFPPTSSNAFIPTFDPIFPTEGTEKSSALAWPIIGGAFAGLVLIFAMMWAFMWRKKTLRPFYRLDSQLQEINPKTDISGGEVTVFAN
ncbi:uncharacterized protein [Pocillopora verrucosa]|uniref:uncharacterized protein isoform X2 n=1 Tax=Pocillopora verrucosa TaxID=203993 RepID=UPI00333EA000